MPTNWNDTFDTGDQAVSAQIAEEDGEGFFKRLRTGLSRSREALAQEIGASLFEKIDDETWEKLEEALIFADVGAPTTAKVVGELEGEVASGRVTGGEAVRDRLAELLAGVATTGEARIDLTHRPSVIMVVGVNGTGKTTTIGKLAWHIQRELGLNVLIAAGDTYRAAAVEQLSEWAERAGCEIVKAEQGGDPGAVAFDAIDAAKARGAEVVIVDTAGRLQTHGNLMEELSKVKRVIQKQIPDAPHEALIVLDATTGQNGLRQAQAFTDAVELSGAVLTKLDGSAKGGVALAIASELGIPVKLIGIGEALEDLRPFDADSFARALISE
ncbi:MAG: fused signal recognition particle receptor [Solirubrobacterales bacterium]|jgi:fused signal recognition particle receptor|nr:fused signal recognition particle receptor [Solirubrobacterales bacterium]